MRTITRKRFHSERSSGTILPARFHPIERTTAHAAAAAAANLSPSSVHVEAIGRASRFTLNSDPETNGQLGAESRYTHRAADGVAWTRNFVHVRSMRGHNVNGNARAM